jgi:hypothetical protein
LEKIKNFLGVFSPPRLAAAGTAAQYLALGFTQGHKNYKPLPYDV